MAEKKSLATKSTITSASSLGSESASALMWWESLTEECPITLEPLNTLPYPPFVLKSRNVAQKQRGDTETNDSNARNYYFDGIALASYMVSRGTFQNPLTREPISRGDCIRLDQYLEKYGNPGSGKVLEAYSLRESVRVIVAAGTYNTTTSANNIPGDEAQQILHRQRQQQLEAAQRRAEVLRNEAASALLGLFTYDRRTTRRGQQSQQQQRRQQQSAVPTFGFDLSRRVDDGNDTLKSDGLTIIDDDEVEVVATERQAWRELQEAFPPLSLAETEGAETTAAMYAARCGNNQSQPNNEDIQMVVENIRQRAQQDEIEELKRNQLIDQARNKLIQDGLKSRENRKKQSQQLRSILKTNYEHEKKEQMELELARAEIDEWYEEQWERLRILSKQRERQRQEEESRQQNKQHNIEFVASNSAVEKEEAVEEISASPVDESSKKAAKRRRARERKKAQKAEEKEKNERMLKEATLQAKKDASSVRCACCGCGIIDCGFEKKGHTFCSPKCARSGPSA